MRRFVVLCHHSPEGSHFDWMIETRESLSPEDRSLLTFRVEVLPTEAGSFAAERIRDHRAVYLTREGDIGQGRGWVERVLEGDAELLECDRLAIVVRLHTVGRVLTLAGASADGVRFHFERRGE